MDYEEYWRDLCIAIKSNDQSAIQDHIESFDQQTKNEEDAADSTNRGAYEVLWDEWCKTYNEN